LPGGSECGEKADCVLEEYADVLGDHPEFVAEIVESFPVCHPLTELSVIRHEPDTRFLECALAADAEFIVTVNTAPGHFDQNLLALCLRPIYIITPHMAASLLERELKRGSTELLILALLDERQRHGYEISQLIEERSNGTITFHTASLYPTLYRLEARGLIEGRWVERAGQRRRRYYRLTRTGRKGLAQQRSTWDTFFVALDRVAGFRHA
jgi:PadR family transcriptional regulator, regulatory protein PadR